MYTVSRDKSPQSDIEQAPPRGRAEDRHDLAFYANIPVVSCNEGLFVRYTNLVDFLSVVNELAAIHLMAPMKQHDSPPAEPLPPVEFANNFASLHALPYYEHSFDNAKNLFSLTMKLYEHAGRWAPAARCAILVGPNVTFSLLSLIMLWKRRRLPLFLFLRGDRRKTSKYHNVGIKRLMAQCKTAINYWLAHYLLSKGKVKGVIGIGNYCVKEFSGRKHIGIHPMIDDLLYKVETKERNFDRPLVFGYIGRLDAEKRIDDIIALFLRLKSPGDKLIMVGGGGLKEDLQQRMDTDLKGSVFLYPHYQDKYHLIKYLDHIDIFLHLAITGSGRSVWEAMARGCVCLVSAGGIDEFLVDGDNCLLKGKSSWARVTEYLQSPGKLRAMSARAREAGEKLTFATARAEMLDFIDNVLAKTP